MGFKETMLFIMNMVRKSIQVELNSFYENVLKTDTTVSKQAYCEARQKIDPKAFIELNDSVNKVVYEQCNDLKLWDGYRLSAIDGTVLELPDTALLRKEFGCSGNQNRMVARAKASCLFDVLNKVIIKSKIERYDTPERNAAVYLINQMVADGRKNDLVLFDRGYPSAAFISFLYGRGVDFLIRLQKNHFSKIIDPNKEDQVIEINFRENTYRVRVVRFKLSSDEEEILITSIHNKKYSLSDFKDLYHLRWGIETKYDVLKNKFELENFTGQTRIAVEQDFYATIYLSNLAELAKKQSDELILKNNENKDIKYRYQTNTNVLVGSLKDKLVLMMLEKSVRKRHKIFKQIIKTISKSVTPVREGRSYKRKRRKVMGKYNPNHKRCL